MSKQIRPRSSDTFGQAAYVWVGHTCLGGAYMPGQAGDAPETTGEIAS